MNRLLREAIRIARDYPEMKDAEVLKLALIVVKDEIEISQIKEGKNAT